MKHKLNKITFNDTSNVEYDSYVNLNILDFINSKLVINQDKIWNYRDNIILVERDNKLYHWYKNGNKLTIVNEQYFITPILGYGIYKDINIFSQNNDKVANTIYSLVIDLLDDLTTQLIKNCEDMYYYGIGGEFYVYFRILKLKYPDNKRLHNYLNGFTYKGYTNNINTLQAAKRNGSCTTYKLIDYNRYDFDMKYNGITLINLSKINKHILNNLKTKYVITITCKDKTIFDNYKSIAIKKIFNLNNVKITVFKVI